MRFSLFISEMSRTLLVFAGILWIFVVPLVLYKVKNPEFFKIREQRIMNQMFPDIIVNAVIRLAGILFILFYTLILIAMLIEKFG